MTPLAPSRNLAARMGRWSASHKKTAIFGWLAFVAAAFVIASPRTPKRRWRRAPRPVDATHTGRRAGRASL